MCKRFFGQRETRVVAECAIVLLHLDSRRERADLVARIQNPFEAPGAQPNPSYRRTDAWGGATEGRAKLLCDIIRAIRDLEEPPRRQGRRTARPPINASSDAQSGRSTAPSTIFGIMVVIS